MKPSLGSSALVGVGLAILVLGTADTADAHVCLVSPVPRVGADCTRSSPQKIGPCGVEGRSQYVTEFRPGETITVELNETVNHPSHYRISFNPEGDLFYDPVTVDDKTGAHPFILVDGIEDAEDARQSVQITFPDVECETCTLQVIQVMYDKGGNGFGGGGLAAGGNDDMYYSCADIALRRSSTGAAVSPTDGASTEEGTDSEPEHSAPPLERFLAARGMGLVVGVRTRRATV